VRKRSGKTCEAPRINLADGTDKEIIAERQTEVIVRSLDEAPVSALNFVRGENKTGPGEAEPSVVGSQT
jgi:hypothetical protein